MYISFPIGKKDEVHFNAHRVFHPTTILKHPSIEKSMRLIRFDFVDDNGDLHLSKSVADIDTDTQFGCGIYTFEKVLASWDNVTKIIKKQAVTYLSWCKNKTQSQYTRQTTDELTGNSALTNSIHNY